MGATVNLVTEPADRVLTIERVLDAPRELISGAKIFVCDVMVAAVLWAVVCAGGEWP
jgi:alkylation response protein AidB-like acyl-CoA dehydrogenase